MVKQLQGYNKDSPIFMQGNIPTQSYMEPHSQFENQTYNKSTKLS